jgi:GWxTD domain-containing protein
MKWTLPSLLTPWVLIAIAAAATAHAVAPSAPAGLGDLIANPAFEDAYERSFETILSDSQLQDYASLPDSEKLVYRRRFWTANDPTPTTDENEFLSEHIRRLQFAVTELCPHEPFVWDDRGDIALRFGVPSSRQRIIGDVITATGLLGIEPNSEIWTYPGAGMSVRFIDWNLSGTYVLGPEVGGLSARPIMHYLPQSYRWWSDFRKTMGPSLVPRDIETEHVVYRVGALVNRGIEVEREVPVAYGYTPPAEPIPVYYEIVTARGDSGATDVAVNYQIPLDCLSFRSDGFMEEARLTKAVRVLTADFDVVTSDARTVTVTREHGEKTADDEMITDEWRLDSVPGEYIVAISVEDTLTGRAGTGVSRITVPDYDHPGFRMSDIQIATSVGEGRRSVRSAGAAISSCTSSCTGSRMTAVGAPSSRSRPRSRGAGITGSGERSRGSSTGGSRRTGTPCRPRSPSMVTPRTPPTGLPSTSGTWPRTTTTSPSRCATMARVGRSRAARASPCWTRRRARGAPVVDSRWSSVYTTSFSQFSRSVTATLSARAGGTHGQGRD